MANTVTAPISTSELRRYEKAGQIELLGNKVGSLADLIDQIQNGVSSIEVIDTNGALASKAGLVLLTKAGVAAMTLTAPAAADNGKVLRILSTTAQAHTVTTPANKINGTLAIATFGGAIGDYVTLVAYNTIWYTLGRLNVTLS